MQRQQLSQHNLLNQPSKKTVSPEPKITVSPEEKIETPAPALTISLSQSPTPATASPAITISPTPKATPTPTITPKPTSNASNAVTIHIVQPNITQEFSVASGDHTDACAILLQAKNENPGKITSLDIVTYPQNNSKYLRELNGFADNWKYTVNGTSPDKDCSQMIVKPYDIIQWKFTSS